MFTAVYGGLSKSVFITRIGLRKGLDRFEYLPLRFVAETSKKVLAFSKHYTRNSQVFSQSFPKDVPCKKIIMLTALYVGLSKFITIFITRLG